MNHYHHHYHHYDDNRSRGGCLSGVGLLVGIAGIGAGVQYGRVDCLVFGLVVLALVTLAAL
jgi:hypothetical protein